MTNTRSRVCLCDRTCKRRARHHSNGQHTCPRQSHMDVSPNSIDARTMTESTSDAQAELAENIANAQHVATRMMCAICSAFVARIATDDVVTNYELSSFARCAHIVLLQTHTTLGSVVDTMSELYDAAVAAFGANTAMTNPNVPRSIELAMQCVLYDLAMVAIDARPTIILGELEEFYAFELMWYKWMNLLVQWQNARRVDMIAGMQRHARSFTRPLQPAEIEAMLGGPDEPELFLEARDKRGEPQRAVLALSQVDSRLLRAAFVFDDMAIMYKDCAEEAVPKMFVQMRATFQRLIATGTRDTHTACVTDIFQLYYLYEQYAEVIREVRMEVARKWHAYNEPRERLS